MENAESRKRLRAEKIAQCQQDLKRLQAEADRAAASKNDAKAQLKVLLAQKGRLEGARRRVLHPTQHKDSSTGAAHS